MPGVAKDYNTNNVLIGPGDLWGKLAVPGAGARLTLATDLTPDATANSTAKHIGMTAEGNKVRYGFTTQDFTVDELTAPIISRIETEEASIEGALVQVTDWDLLDLLAIGAAKSTGTGYEALTFGGNTSITGTSIALIAPRTDDATKAVVFHLYNAYNVNPIEFEVRKNTLARIPYNFRGLSVSSRALADRVGNLWRQVA